MSLRGAVHVSSSPPPTLGGWSSSEAGRHGEQQSEPWSDTMTGYAHQGSGDDDDAASWEEYHHQQPKTGGREGGREGGRKRVRDRIGE